jgi:hypothetical protein
MLIFVIAVGAVILPLVFGGILAYGTSRLDAVVTETKEEIENKDKGYNPGLTLGHKIKVTKDPDEQLKEARILVAKRVASQPRSANMRIGRLGHSNLKTAAQALDEDPWTTVKIAQYHGFDGAKTGTMAAAAAAVATGGVAATAVAAPSGKIELVPGKDYEHVEISDSMSGAEKRQARIANAKAKSRAYKASNTSREATGGVPVAAAPAAAPAAQPVAAAQAVPTGIPEPNYIEITDDMSPDDVRKARINNSKEKSQYNKALKAAGFDPKAVEAGEVVVPVAAAVPAPTPEPAAAAAASAAAPASTGGPDPAALASIPKPDYIDITDDMSPDEIRQARIQNSKTRSAYNKALKAAGIDPKSVE